MEKDTSRWAICLCEVTYVRHNPILIQHIRQYDTHISEGELIRAQISLKSKVEGLIDGSVYSGQITSQTTSNFDVSIALQQQLQYFI